MVEDTINSTSAADMQIQIQELKNTIADSARRRKDSLRQSFLRRLESYTPANYFAKPEALSPIVCSRFGWKLVQKDTLCCEYCRAVWVVLLPDEWWSGRDALIRSYCLKLADSHKESCCYRPPAKQYVQLEHSSSSIPTVLASVFPQGCLELYEVPDPINLFREKYHEFKTLLQLEETNAKQIEIPAELRREDPSTMLQLRHIILGTLSEGETIVDDAAILLTVFGWHKPDNSLMMSCPFCLAKWTLPKKTEPSSSTAPVVQEETAEDDEQRPWKRMKSQRTICPSLAHRHYCPVVSGFPTMKQLQAKPLYKLLIDRLLHPLGHVVNDDTINEIHKMLRAGVSPKRVTDVTVTSRPSPAHV